MLKLADFGLAINMNEEAAVTRAGTLHYMAPEVLACPLKDDPEENKGGRGGNYMFHRYAEPSALVPSQSLVILAGMKGAPPAPRPPPPAAPCSMMRRGQAAALHQQRRHLGSGLPGLRAGGSWVGVCRVAWDSNGNMAPAAVQASKCQPFAPTLGCARSTYRRPQTVGFPPFIADKTTEITARIQQGQVRARLMQSLAC